MQEIPIRGFLGLNLRDAADKVQDNEFSLLQNCYRPTKGVFARRFGSTAEQTTGFDLASRVSGVWRHYGANGDRITLYHCEPDATLLPDNTSDLTLLDLNDGLGDLFAGGAVVTLRVCYSWIGRGLEQTYNSRNRAGFPASGGFPTSAWLNPAHQTITLGGNTHSLKVTIPAFPTGVTGANIFVSRGAVTEMCYVGTITTSAGNLTVRETISAAAVGPDPMVGTDAQPNYTSTGTLKPGTYYVSFAWLCDRASTEGNVSNHGLTVVNQVTVKISGEHNSIFVLGPNANSAPHGGRAAFVFIGTQPYTVMPHTCVGILRSDPVSQFNTMYIDSIPSHNAATSPAFIGPDVNGAFFWAQVNSCDIGSCGDARFPTYKFTETTQSRYQARFGFMMAKTASGAIREIFPSRTWVNEAKFGVDIAIFAGDQVPDWSLGFGINYHNYYGNPRTPNDTFRLVNAFNTAWIQPFQYRIPPSDPTFCYQLGVSFMANGADLPWMCDGYSMCQITPVHAATQTLLPPPPKFILAYQSSLVAFGAFNDNLLYQSNANNPQNWAVGGTGAAIRFAVIGDAVGSGGTSLGIFTPQTEATSNPSSFLIAWKKNGTWMVPTIPDPASNSQTGALLPYTGGALTQVSGRVGCVAYRTPTQTPLGTMFLGQDANIYLINSVSEPRRIGTKVQNALSHLVGNDTAMKMCTAVYHDNHFKLSFPSDGASANDSELWADLRTEEGEPITWVGPHQGRSIGPQMVLVGESDNLSRIYSDGLAVRTVTADDTSTYADLAANGSAQSIALKIMSKKFRFATEGHIKRYFGAILDMYLDFAFTNNVLFEGWADSYYQQVNRQLSVGGAVWNSSLFDQSFFADAEWMGFSFLFGPDNLIGRTFQWQVSSSDQAPLILAAAVMSLKGEKRTIVG